MNNAFDGIKIITSIHMVDEKPKLLLHRPFWRRLLDGRMHDITTETVPSESFFKLDDFTVVMHPQMLSSFREL